MHEFDDIVRRLRDERPQLSALELDEIKQRARKRAQTPRKGQSMRSRVAILAMLVLGFVFSTAGAGLAIQGFSDSGSASQVQYGPLGQDDEGDVEGETESGGPEVVGQDDNGDVQPARQVEVGAQSQLPFTGFAAIPVLIGGVALLSGGLVLRRRSSE
jgi:hypothetical protein